MNDTAAVATPEIDARPDTAPAVATATMLDLFGKPALLLSEDANLYDALLSRVVAAARPRDPFEWMLLKDYADLAWEIFRLRRAKAGVADGRRRGALFGVLDKLGISAVPALKYYSDPDAKAAILGQLADHGLDEEAITAEAVVGCCGRLAALDSMIASAEHRRNAMLREIDYHRGGLATRLRSAPDVIDAESEDTPPVAASPEPQPA